MLIALFTCFLFFKHTRLTSTTRPLNMFLLLPKMLFFQMSPLLPPLRSPLGLCSNVTLSVRPFLIAILIIAVPNLAFLIPLFQSYFSPWYLPPFYQLNNLITCDFSCYSNYNISANRVGILLFLFTNMSPAHRTLPIIE